MTLYWSRWPATGWSSPTCVRRLGEKWDRDWLLGWRDITNASNERTFFPCVIPLSATGDGFLLAFPA